MGLYKFTEGMAYNPMRILFVGESTYYFVANERWLRQYVVAAWICAPALLLLSALVLFADYSWSDRSAAGARFALAGAMAVTALMATMLTSSARVIKMTRSEVGERLSEPIVIPIFQLSFGAAALSLGFSLIGTGDVLPLAVALVVGSLAWTCGILLEQLLHLIPGAPRQHH